MRVDCNTDTSEGEKADVNTFVEGLQLPNGKDKTPRKLSYTYVVYSMSFQTFLDRHLKLS